MAALVPVGVKSYLYGESLPENTGTGLVNALCADINAVGGNRFWSTVTLPQIRWIQKTVKKQKLEKHPLCVKANEVLKSRFYKEPQNLGLWIQHDCYSAMQLHDHGIKPREKSDSSRTISQGNKTARDFYAPLRLGKRTNAEVDFELTRVDTRILEELVDEYYRTKSLTIHYRPNYGEFTDEGLKKIGELKGLEKLELDLWEAEEITREGLHHVLKALCPHLQSLSLTTCLVNDQTLAIIAGMSNLQHLSLVSPSMTSAGLELMTKSPSLQSKLCSLTLRKGQDWGTLVTKQLLANIKSFSYNFKELTLDGKGEFDSQDLVQMLKRTCFFRLHLNGFPISNEVVSHLASHQQNLQELYLGDCSQVDANQLEDLTQNSPTATLASLGLAYGAHFQTSKRFDRFNVKQRLSHLSLTSCPWLTLNDAQIKSFRSLTYLEITDNPQITGISFASLGKLPYLKCLRVIGCTNVNDAHIKDFVHEGSPPLQALELNRVSIGSEGMRTVATSLKALQTLSVTACGGVTPEDWRMFLSYEPLQRRVCKLQLNLMHLGEDVPPLFKAFKQLDVLMICCPITRTEEEASLYRQSLIDNPNAYVVVELSNDFAGHAVSSWPRFVNA